MRMIPRLMLVLAAAAALTGNPAWAKTYNIAFMTFGIPEYPADVISEMNKYPLVKDGTIKLNVIDGRYDAGTQDSQMDTVITQKYDAVIFSPIDADAAAGPIARAKQAGIPVIVTVVGANSEDLTSFVCTDDVESGRLITNHVIDKMGGKGNVVILEGPIGQSSQIARRQGIDEVLAKHPDVKLLTSKPANWSRAEGLTTMENWIATYGDAINGVISENDEMALGAIQALDARGMTSKVAVASVDGIQDGVRAVKSKGLFTVYKSAHAEGQGSLDVAMRAIVGEKFKPLSDVWTKTLDWKDGTAKRYVVPWVAVTPANADQFLR